MYKITNGYISDIGAWNLDIICDLAFGAWDFSMSCTFWGRGFNFL